MLANFDVIAIFPIYGQFGAIWKPDSWKTYILINNNLLSYKNWKQVKNLWQNFHTIALSKGTICQKMLIFSQKNADISKIKKALVLKSMFSESTVVCTNFQVSSNSPPPPKKSSKQAPKKL